MNILTPYRGLDKLVPEMQKRVNAFLVAAKAAGFNILITETYRSYLRQKWLYAAGRDRPGPKVTWTMQSRHLLGQAIDVCFLHNGKASWDGDWNGLGKIGEQCGLQWGGRFPVGQTDRPHFQLPT